MLADDEILKMKLREALKKVEEGCAGGVCSIGGGGSGGSNSVKNNGTRVASLNGMTRQQAWNEDDKEDVIPQKPDTKYKKTEDGKPFTAEEEKQEDWTQKQLQFENEIRMDDPQHTANDLKSRYVSMMSAEDQYEALNTVTDHFDQSGQDYEVMVRVGETTKSVPEWEAEIERGQGEGQPPAVPDLPPTEGGYSPEERPENGLDDMVPFPDSGEPPL